MGTPTIEAVRGYIKRTGADALLSDHQVRRLMQQARNGDDKAKAVVWNGHLRLVVAVARRCRSRLSTKGGAAVLLDLDSTG